MCTAGQIRTCEDAELVTYLALLPFVHDRSILQAFNLLITVSQKVSESLRLVYTVRICLNGSQQEGFTALRVVHLAHAGMVRLCGFETPLETRDVGFELNDQ